MPKFDIAHIKQQGIDLIIIPLDKSFGYKTLTEQNAITRELQMRASSAGLSGTAVPVWEGAGGKMKSLPPPNFRPFFESIDLYFVVNNINRYLSW